jgi:hypothetical protein
MEAMRFAMVAIVQEGFFKEVGAENTEHLEELDVFEFAAEAIEEFGLSLKKLAHQKTATTRHDQARNAGRIIPPTLVSPRTARIRALALCPRPNSLHPPQRREHPPPPKIPELCKRYNLLEKEIEAIGTHVHLLEKEWAVLGFPAGLQGEECKVDLSGFQAYILKRFPLLENVQWIRQAFKRITTRAGHLDGEGTTEVSQADFPLLLRAYYYLSRLHLAFPNIEADGQQGVDLEEFRGGHQWLGLSLRHVYSKVAFLAMDSEQTGAITFEQVSEWYFGQKGLGFLEDLEYGSEARKQLAYLPKQPKDHYFSKPSTTSYLSKQSKYVFPKRGSLSPTKARKVDMEEVTLTETVENDEGVDKEAGALSATTSGRTSVVAPTTSLKKTKKGSKGSVSSPQMSKATTETTEAPSETVIEMEAGLGATTVTEETKEDATRPGKGMDSRGGTKNKRGLPAKVANAKSKKPDRKGKSPAKSKEDVGAV